MAMDPVTAILEISGKVIDKIWPDPAQAANAKFELFKLQQEGYLKEMGGQLAVNLEEAKNPSVFVSGWRPFVGWVCGMGLVYSFIGQPLLSWVSLNWHINIPPALDLSTLLTILMGMLGLGGLRTIEKTSGVAAK